MGFERMMIAPMRVQSLSETVPRLANSPQSEEIIRVSLEIVSRAFAHGKSIPDKYTCNGENVSPPLTWRDVPHAAKELVLIVDDPDAPSGTFVHWLLYNVSPSESELDEGISGGTETLANGAGQGVNGFRRIGYAGPCPPSGTHRYYFHLYAVDSNLNLPPGVNRDKIDQAMKNHVLEEAELMGYYAKK
jgi:hypothetical protein